MANVSSHFFRRNIPFSAGKWTCRKLCKLSCNFVLNKMHFPPFLKEIRSDDFLSMNSGTMRNSERRRQRKTEGHALRLQDGCRPATEKTCYNGKRRGYALRFHIGRSYFGGVRSINRKRGARCPGYRCSLRCTTARRCPHRQRLRHWRP